MWEMLMVAFALRGALTRDGMAGRALRREERRGSADVRGIGMMESDARPVRSMDDATVVEGDRVRLKFLYPNGSMEVLDCTWISATNLGPPENPNAGWVVVSADDRVFWKPLSHMIQLEMLEPNEAARSVRRGNGFDLDRYHR